MIVRGDLFEHLNYDENTLIVHVCNDVGKWGSGFVLEISKYNEEPQRVFRTSYYVGLSSGLGAIQVCDFIGKVKVINMIAQSGIKSISNPVPLNYEALRGCLQDVRHIAKQGEYKVVMPKIGAARAGGDWSKIYSIIEDELINHNIKTEVYIL